MCIRDRTSTGPPLPTSLFESGSAYVQKPAPSEYQGACSVDCLRVDRASTQGRDARFLVSSMQVCPEAGHVASYQRFIEVPYVDKPTTRAVSYTHLTLP